MSRQTSYNPDQKSLAHSVKIATSCTRFLINIHAHIAFTISYLDPPPLFPLQCSVTPGESKGPFQLKKNFHGQKMFRKYHC